MTAELLTPRVVAVDRTVAGEHVEPEVVLRVPTPDARG